MGNQAKSAYVKIRRFVAVKQLDFSSKCRAKASKIVLFHRITSYTYNTEFNVIDKNMGRHDTNDGQHAIQCTSNNDNVEIVYHLV